MSDRITGKDCAATLARIVTALEGEAPDVRQLGISHESGVWRLRWNALDPGTWVSDVGPGFSTARELDTFLRGIFEGLGVVETIRRHVESDISIHRHNLQAARDGHRPFDVRAEQAVIARESRL